MHRIMIKDRIDSEYPGGRGDAMSIRAKEARQRIGPGAMYVEGTDGHQYWLDPRYRDSANEYLGGVLTGQAVARASDLIDIREKGGGGPKIMYMVIIFVVVSVLLGPIPALVALAVFVLLMALKKLM